MMKAVLLDIDNTLLDFDAYVQTAMKEGFRIFGLGEYKDEMYPVFLRINAEMWGGIEQGALTYEDLLQERWNRIFSALGISFDGRRFEDYFKDSLFDSAIPVQGAMEILTYLKERYILCIASNGPYAQQLNRLQKGDMLSFFSHLFISEKIGVLKPSSKFFAHCLKELNANQTGKDRILPSEVMMIGDSLSSDIAGAIVSGLKTCYFDKYGSGETKNLPIDYVIGALDEIKTFL